MAMTDKKRLTDNAWQKKNYKRVGAKLYKEDAEAFEKYCKENNISMNAAIKNYIAQCIGRPLTVRSEASEEENE